MNDALFQHYIVERCHHAARHPFGHPGLAEEYAARGLSFRERMADRFVLAAAAEEPYMEVLRSMLTDNEPAEAVEDDEEVELLDED